MIRLDTYEDHIRMIDTLALADGTMPTAYLRPMAAHWVNSPEPIAYPRVAGSRAEEFKDRVTDGQSYRRLTPAEAARMVGLKEVR